MGSWLEREELLLGAETVERLRKASVLAVGLGGVGGIAVEMIVRSGVGRLTIVDGDVVEDSNRNRQIAALSTTSGRLKTEVMAERLLAIDPELELNVISRFLKAEEMGSLVSGGYQCILDAIDSLAPKTALIAAAAGKKIPIVSSMGSGAHLDPDRIRCVPVKKTFNCPLAKAVRNGLRELPAENLRYCRAVFTEELPIPGGVVDQPHSSGGKRAVQGTISYMPAMFGCRCAAEVIRILTGVVAS